MDISYIGSKNHPLVATPWVCQFIAIRSSHLSFADISELESRRGIAFFFFKNYVIDGE